nr:hypothetical protein [Tanacetum cinerariifolium]
MAISWIWFNLHKDILRDALALQPITTIFLWLHLQVIQSSNTSTLWDTQVLSGTCRQCRLTCALQVKCWIRQTKTSYAADSVRKNISKASRGKKKTTYLLIPSIRFTKLIIHHLKTKHNIHPRSGSPLHYSHDESVLNIEGMLERMVGKSLAAEGGVTESSKATKVTKPKAAKATKPASDRKPKPAPTQPPEGVPEKKQKLVKETHDEPSPVKRSKGGRVRKIRKPMRSLKRTPMPAEASGPSESPSLDAEQALTNSKTESDDEVPKINTGDQDEG